MKIETTTNNGSTYTTLADEAPGSGARDVIAFVPPRFESDAAFVNLFQGTSAKLGPQAGYNRRWVFEFSVERVHATLAAAWEYYATHAAALPPNAFDVKITQGSTSTYLHECAFVSFAPPRHLGLTNVCSYVIAAETLNNTAPTP